MRFLVATGPWREQAGQSKNIDISLGTAGLNFFKYTTDIQANAMARTDLALAEITAAGGSEL